jgi:hypothetical protein
MNVAKNLKESFLRQVFGVGNVFRHLKANGVNAFLVQLKQGCERFLVAELRALHHAALGIIALGFAPDSNEVSLSRGNYASGHVVSPYR